MTLPVSTKASVTIETAGHSAACGRSFEQGIAYLVYARERNGQLTDNLCSRTRLSKAASEDFEVLGEGKSHSDDPAAEDAGPPAREPPRIEQPPATEPLADPMPGKKGCSVSARDLPVSSMLPLALALALRRR